MTRRALRQVARVLSIGGAVSLVRDNVTDMIILAGICIVLSLLSYADGKERSP